LRRSRRLGSPQKPSAGSDGAVVPASSSESPGVAGSSSIVVTSVALVVSVPAESQPFGREL